jgi:hypothetical protein
MSTVYETIPSQQHISLFILLPFILLIILMCCGFCDRVKKCFKGKSNNSNSSSGGSAVTGAAKQHGKLMGKGIRHNTPYDDVADRLMDQILAEDPDKPYSIVQSPDKRNDTDLDESPSKE